MNEHRIDYETKRERAKEKKRTQLNHDRIVVREEEQKKKKDNHYRSSEA